MMQFRMLAPSRRCLVLIGCILFVGGGTPTSAARADDPVLHVVLVIDLDAPSIKNNMEPDLDALRREFKDHVHRPQHLHQVERTAGLTRQNVLGLFSQGRVEGREVDPNDAIVFIFDGHGTFDPDSKDLSFNLGTNGEQVLRSEVVQAVRECHPRLSVIVNGSCTNIVRKSPLKFGFKALERTIPPDTAFSPLFEKLFVQPKGSVLLSASRPGEFAAAYPGISTPGGDALIFRGTIFVQALAHEFSDFNPVTVQRTVDQQGTVPEFTLPRAAEPPDWPQLIDRLQKIVATNYERFIVPIDAFPGQPTQTVTAVLDLDSNQGASIARWGIGVAPTPNGLKIVAVTSGSWAEGANLKVGDTIVGLNALELDSPAELRDALAGLGDDDLFRVVGIRANGQPFTFLRRLREGVVQLPEPRRLGVTVNPVPQGLLLVTVDDKSLAKRLGLEPGDILVSLNGRATRQAADVSPALAKTSSNAMVNFQVIDVNTGQIMSLTRNATND